MRYPDPLIQLIEVLKLLPGVGTKSAERFAFDMLGWSTEQLKQMSLVVGELKNKLTSCSDCGCLTQENKCLVCLAHNRDREVICIIASPRDAFAMERTREYRGLYHVLGGLLSPLDGRSPDDLTVTELHKRIKDQGVKELVFALDSTLEGDATALFLKNEFEPYQLKMSRLAFGLPMGSSLDYVDGDTLARAFSGRRIF